MSLLLYLFRAVTLLRCAVSSGYRVEICARWKKTPTHLVIYEIGGGILGLITLVALLWLIWVRLG